MIELVIMAGATVLVLVGTVMYLTERDNDRLRVENHQLREENRMLHVKAGIPLPEEES